MKRLKTVLKLDRYKNFLITAINSRPFVVIALAIVLSVALIRISTFEEPYNGFEANGMSDLFIVNGITEGNNLTLEGKVEEITVKESNGGTVDYIVTLSQVEVLIGDGKKVITHLGEKVQVTLLSCDIKIGQRIQIVGRLSYFYPATNWGEFDAYSFYSNRGILFSIKSAHLTRKGESYSKVRQYLWELRGKISYIIDGLYEALDGAILKAMLLGIKNEIPQSVKESFQKSGIAHILAISGLHISFFGLLAYKLLELFRFNNVICALGSGLFLGAYITMVGFSASAMRAGIMFLIYVLSKVVKRSYDMISSMSFSLIIISSFNPWLIFDSALLLSFSAVIGIGIVYKLILNNAIFLKEALKMRDSSRIKGRLYNRIVVGGIKSITSTAAVFAVTLPVLLYSYYEVAIYSILLNVIILPFMPMLLVSGTVAIALTGKVEAIAAIFVKISHFILQLYINSCAWLEGTGLGRINLGKPELWQVILYYMVLLLFCIYRFRYAVLAKSLCVVVCCVILYPVDVDGIYMLDVGQGDGIVLINDKHEAFLIDGGSNSRQKVGENVIIPFLKSKGVSDIKGIFVTHPDSDHMNGVLELVNNSRKECIRIHNIYVYDESLKIGDYKALQDMVSDTNEMKIYGIRKGYSIIDDDVRVECIYPEGGYSEDSNSNSLVLLLNYKDLTMLETGDLEESGELEIIGENLQVDVLKVAHHGSASSSCLEFLENVNPRIALISAGRNNSYGHPHEETLYNLSKLNIPYKCTKEDGAMRVYGTKEDICIEKYTKIKTKLY